MNTKKKEKTNTRQNILFFAILNYNGYYAKMLAINCINCIVIICIKITYYFVCRYFYWSENFINTFFSVSVASSEYNSTADCTSCIGLYKSYRIANAFLN